MHLLIKYAFFVLLSKAYDLSPYSVEMLHSGTVIISNVELQSIDHWHTTKEWWYNIIPFLTLLVAAL